MTRLQELASCAVPDYKMVSVGCGDLRALIAEVERLTAENATLKDMELIYSNRMGELAQLSDIVCTWVLENRELAYMPDDVGEAADEIMEYVEAVRP